MGPVRVVLLTLVVAMATLGPGLTAVVTPAANAAYPGDDSRIAFVRANQIYTMSSTGGSVTQLTSTGKNYRPEWSPDGRRISYIHQEAGLRDVWVMSARGTGQRAVTTSGDVTSAGASWSPDGTRLAYAAGAETDGFTTEALHLISATESSATPVVPSGYESGSWCDGDPLAVIPVDRFLSWSPDGSTIAVFNRRDCYYDYALWMFHPDTGELAQIRALGADCCGYATWTDLFFGPTGEFGYSERDLGDYGEEVGPLLISYPGFASSDGDTGGAPSPSGRFIAFTNASSGTARVVRARVDGTHRKVLANGYQPDWRPLP